MPVSRPSGRCVPPAEQYLSLTLHAHLPYVVNHGTWPHGLEWLHEAAAETYLPLLRLLRHLHADGITPHWSIDFSPVLLEQLTHPVFLAEFPQYLKRKIRYAHEDEAFFEQAREPHFVYLARYWQARYSEALQDFEALDGNIVREFGRMQTLGMVDLLTCSATHGYNPLLGTDESVRAQTRLAMATHRKHFGAAPNGMWLPECGYRPAGYWQPPTQDAAGAEQFPGFFRIGVDEALQESGLSFFFIDAHLVEQSQRFASPYGDPTQSGSSGGGEHTAADVKLYHPYRLAGDALTVFPRDPRTGYQVWSGDHGYPADGAYLDFHKKRWPGGHRYWQVTGAGVDLADKLPYHPDAAALRTEEHARHFLSVVEEALSEVPPDAGRAAVLTAPFDAELFGHWWWEGVHFLEHVARALAGREAGVKPITAANYVRRYPATDEINLPEGSWGAGGDNRVWLNTETSWTYALIYKAEHELREVCTTGEWRDGSTGERIVKQLCRELLLLESSDWQFLITTGAARDYAERRFRDHADCFDRMYAMWRSFEAERQLLPEQLTELSVVEEIDGIFADVNPEFWVRGAKAAA